MFEAVHRLRALVDTVEADQPLGHDPPLRHGVGEDRVDVAFPGEPVAGLGHVPGGVDVRVAGAQIVVDGHAPLQVQPGPRQTLEVRLDAGRRHVHVHPEPLVAGEADRLHLGVALERLGRLVEVHRDPAPLQGVEHDLARLLVHPSGHHPAARDHRHVQPEVAQQQRHLDADEAGPDDQRAGDLAAAGTLDQRGGGAQRLEVVHAGQLDPGQLGMESAAGGDHEPVVVQRRTRGQRHLARGGVDRVAGGLVVGHPEPLEHVGALPVQRPVAAGEEVVGHRRRGVGRERLVVHDVEVELAGRGELPEPLGDGQPGGPGTQDHDAHVNASSDLASAVTTPPTAASNEASPASNSGVTLGSAASRASS